MLILFFKKLFTYLAMPGHVVDMGSLVFVAACGSLFFFFFFMLQHMGFSSLPRDQTQAPCIGSAVLATGPPGKSRTVIIMKYPFLLELMLFVLKYTLCKFNIATLPLITSVYMVSFPIILLFIYLCYYINISTISLGNRVQLSLAFLASVTVFPL